MSITKLTLAAFAFTYGNAVTLEKRGLKAVYGTSTEQRVQIAAKCEKMHGVNELTANGYTTTNNFNWTYNRHHDKLLEIYSVMGSEHYPAITPESCEAVDCMHPCYGEDQ